MTHTCVCSRSQHQTLSHEAQALVMHSKGRHGDSHQGGGGASAGLIGTESVVCPLADRRRNAVIRARIRLLSMGGIIRLLYPPKVQEQDQLIAACMSTLSLTVGRCMFLCTGTNRVPSDEHDDAAQVSVPFRLDSSSATCMSLKRC